MAAAEPAPPVPPPEAWQTPTERPLAPGLDDTQNSFEFPRTRRRPAIRAHVPRFAIAGVALAAAGVAAAFLLGRSDEGQAGPTTSVETLADPTPVERERIGLAVADGAVFLALPRGRLVRATQKGLDTRAGRRVRMAAAALPAVS